MLVLVITHHSLDKVQVLGHHVVEVVSDENSPHEKLKEKVDSLPNGLRSV